MDMRTERAVALIAFAVMSSAAFAEGARPPRLPRLSPDAPVAAMRERLASGRTLSRSPNPCETLFRRAERAAALAPVADRSREKGDAAAACAVDPEAGAQRIGFAGTIGARTIASERVAWRHRAYLRGPAMPATEPF